MRARYWNYNSITYVNVSHLVRVYGNKPFLHDEKILNKHNVNLYNAEFLCGDKIIQYVSVSVLVLENYVSFHNKPDLNVTKWNNCDGASNSTRYPDSDRLPWQFHFFCFKFRRYFSGVRSKLNATPFAKI